MAYRQHLAQYDPQLFKARAAVINKATDYAQRRGNKMLKGEVYSMRERLDSLTTESATAPTGEARLFAHTEAFILEAELTAYRAELLGRSLGLEIPHPYRTGERR